MKVKFFLILITGILIGGAAVILIAPGVRAPKVEAIEEARPLYSCGMHPEVISDKPGNCPICGMTLTPIKSTAQDLGQVQTGEAGRERRLLYWRAPMDATEIYDKPGKSRMGMDLVPVYEGEEAGGAGSITIDGTLRQNMNLRTAPVTRRDIIPVIRAFGRVAYAEDGKSSVTTKINGWVEKLYVNTTGQQVRVGQPLLEIYSPELVATQDEYLLALKNAGQASSSTHKRVRENADRMLALARDRLLYWDISPAEIDEIEATGRARKTILLKSRITGVVTHKAVVAGDRIGPGKVLFHIADLSRVWVEAAIYESELELVRAGQKAELTLDHLGGEQLEGTVDFIYPYLDPKSRANNVRLVFQNPGLRLKPEMYATVRINTPAARDVPTIPTEAVIHSGKRKLVFVTSGGGKFEPREIKLGAESGDGNIEVVSGLFDHEEVVVSGQFLLDSESRTREAIAKLRSAQAQARSAVPPEEKKTTEPHAAGHATPPPQTQHDAKAHKEKEPGHESHEPKKPEIDINRLYACPMHPEFITTDPDAPCPICGMDLVKAVELGDKIDPGRIEFYTCPMHPDFLTTDKDARCPECGMALETVKEP